MLQKGYIKAQKNYPIRNETYANYKEHAFDEDGRVGKIGDDVLAHMWFEHHPQEIIWSIVNAVCILRTTLWVLSLMMKVFAVDAESMKKKFTLDWQSREQKLQALLERYKSTSGLNYDCIVPVSGARDSYFIVHLLKNV